MRVLKFGGTSIAGVEELQRVIEIVRSRGAGVVVVASAIGSTTDELERLVELAAESRLGEARRAINDVRERHFLLATELLADGPRRHEVLAHWAWSFDRLDAMVASIAVLEDLSPGVRARVLSVGELLSTRFLAAVLADAGVPAQWVDARELVVTDDAVPSAEPILKETTRQAVEHLVPVLAAGGIPVVPGFLARTRGGLETTLGRGGSDCTAAVLGACLGATEIEIWTDVDGIMTADPSVVPGARNIPVMSFQEAAELAFFGARVLHPKTLVAAVERQIPVRVCNTHRPDGRGTLILAEAPPEEAPVKSIAYKEGMSLIKLTSERMFGDRGFLNSIFDCLQQHEVMPHVVATSMVSVAVAASEPEAVRRVVAELEGLGRVEVQTGQAVVSVVGERLTERPGIVGDVFAALGSIRTGLVSLGGSQINLGFVVDEADLELVVRRLHARFFEDGAAGAVPQTRAAQVDRLSRDDMVA